LQIVQQHRGALVLGQRLQHGPQVGGAVRARVGHVTLPGGGDVQRPALPLQATPVIAQEVHRRLVEIRVRVVGRGPPRHQPGERLGGDVVRRVVVDLLAHPPREPRVLRREELAALVGSGQAAAHQLLKTPDPANG
jgi:hypothetical protein